MALHRSTSFQCRNVSRTPCMTPPSRLGVSRAMLLPWVPSSIISGMANRPTVTATKDSPSQRNRAFWFPRIGSRVKRDTLVIASSPTMASIKPKPPIVKPLARFPPLRDARKVIPRTLSMRNSGAPMERTSGWTMGIASANAKAPKIAPTSELMSAAPKARPASPRLAMAWPSTTVAAVMPSPGTPKSTEVMSPVVAVTA